MTSSDRSRDTSPEDQSWDLLGDEQKRLVALHELMLLDTPPEQSFDRVTLLASKALRAPIVLFSLIDESRQWFKSRVGLAAPQTSREVAFCTHAIAQDAPLIVEDARIDPRFAANPLVTGMPRIRAYMGVPVHTSSGHPIGTLCVIDHVARAFNPDQVALLQEYASILEESIRARELAARTRKMLDEAREQARLFRQTFEQASVGIIHTALDGHLIRANPQACRMLGYQESELTALSFVDITHSDDVGSNTRLFERMLAGEIPNLEVEKRFKRGDGEFLWAHLSASLKCSVAGVPEHTITVIKDISERKQAAEALLQAKNRLADEVASQTRKLQEANDALRLQIKQSFAANLAVCRTEARLRAIANNMPALIGYWNSSLRCEFANQAYRDWFGIDPQRVLEMRMQDLLGDALFASLQPRIFQALEGIPQRFERAHVRADGASIITDCRYVPDANEAGDVRGFYVLLTDVTALRAAQQALEDTNAKLAADSVTDYLTGLANRRRFSEASERACAALRQSRRPYGLILLDLDDFKRINDQHGHDVGDEVLRAVGRILREQVRHPHDLAARLGGEEFAVLCFDTADQESLLMLAERIRAQICKESLTVGSVSVAFTGSFGVAAGRVDDEGWRGIYARADLALYAAKAEGKNRVVFREVASQGLTGRFRALPPMSAA